MPRHDCLPPHQTGREDFPHPAFTQTLAAQPYAGRNQLSSAAQPRSKMRTVPQPCGWLSVGGLSSRRNSHPLIQHVCVPGKEKVSTFSLVIGNKTRFVRIRNGGIA